MPHTYDPRSTMQFHVIRHGAVDSTSERAFAALAAGSAKHGDVHVADSQTAGRGRQGRKWHSPSAGGLYASVVLLPEVQLSAAGLTIAAGLAVHDAAHRLGVRDAALEWPNDVVVPIASASAIPATSAKLAGILVETRGLDPSRPHYVVGMGVNVAQHEFPRELTDERRVTSLRLQGSTATIDGALDALLQALSRRLGAIRADPLGLARDYVSATGLAGRRARVHTGDGAFDGRIETFDIHGGLELVAADRGARKFALEVVRAIDVL